MGRASAADFSRKRSARVFIGQCHITELGFWHGGQPGYGLRRQLLDEHGNARGRLEYGQQKYLRTDRVILTPGPDLELKTVKRIFDCFVVKGKQVTAIADELNTDQIRTSRGNTWSRQTIDKILSNETYIGNIVFNRTSYKLRQRTLANPPELWVRRTHALEPVIAPELFAKAQKLLAKRRSRLTNQEALDRLSALWREKGHLSHKIIVAADNVPDTSTYIKRFGSLSSAYKLIGFGPRPRYRWLETQKRLRLLTNKVVEDIVGMIVDRGGIATFDEAARLFTVDKRLPSQSVLHGTSRKIQSERDGMYE